MTGGRDVKMCHACLLDKPLVGGFFRNGAHTDGLDRVCKDCMKARYRIETVVLGSGNPEFLRRLRDERRRGNVRDGTEGSLVRSLVEVFHQFEEVGLGGKTFRHLAYSRSFAALRW